MTADSPDSLIDAEAQAAGISCPPSPAEAAWDGRERRAQPRQMSGQGGESRDVARLLSSHRDWRVNTADPMKSVVFSSKASGGQLAPLAGQSPMGVPYRPVFYALQGAIANYRVKAMSDPANKGEVPRSFAVNVEGVRVRVQHVQGDTFHVRVPGDLLPMDKLGLPDGLQRLLMSDALNEGGLVVVCGGYGSGKTTTVNAIVRGRVAKLGGYALVLGNPIEYEYQGFHGVQGQPGYIEQVDLVGLDLDAEIRASMRNFPSGATSIMAYPELVGHMGVGEMLRAANRGNLVFADMHAMNIEGAILNLVSMARADNEPYARELLGNSLRLVIHQRSHVQAGSKRLHVAVKHLAVDKALGSAIGNTAVSLPQVFAGSLAFKGGQ